MRKVVVKFGGSNLKRPEDVARLAGIVRSYDVPVVIVVSALHGITRLISVAMDRVRRSEREIATLREALRVRYTEFVEANISDPEIVSEVCLRMEEALDRLTKLLTGVHCLADVPDFAADRVLSFGERLSSLLLSAVLRSHGVSAVEKMPEEIGLITDGVYGGATVDLDASRAGLRKALSGADPVVIPGFYGVSRENNVTVLGTGGSDYSAAAIAGCIDAESVDFWKDVDGFLTGDPEQVVSPLRIEELSYAEAAELSYFGARIFHPRTVEPLMEENIPVRVFSVNATDMGPCTVVKNSSSVHRKITKSVTWSDDVGILQLRGPGVGIRPGIIADAGDVFKRHGMNIRSVITSQTTINILFSRRDVRRAGALLDATVLTGVDEIAVRDDVSLVAVVGEGMVEQWGVAARALNALSSHRINVVLSSIGASPVAAYFMVERSGRELALRSIHDAFFHVESMERSEQ